MLLKTIVIGQTELRKKSENCFFDIKSQDQTATMALQGLFLGPIYIMTFYVRAFKESIKRPKGLSVYEGYRLRTTTIGTTETKITYIRQFKKVRFRTFVA